MTAERFDEAARTQARSSRRGFLGYLSGLLLLCSLIGGGWKLVEPLVEGEDDDDPPDPAGYRSGNTLVTCGSCKEIVEGGKDALDESYMELCQDRLVAMRACARLGWRCVFVAAAVCVVGRMVPGSVGGWSLCRSERVGKALQLGDAPCLPEDDEPEAGVNCRPGQDCGDGSGTTTLTVPRGMVLLIGADEASCEVGKGALRGTRLRGTDGVVAAYAGQTEIDLTFKDGWYELVAEERARDMFCYRLGLAERSDWKHALVSGLPEWGSAPCTASDREAPPPVVTTALAEDYSGPSTRSWSIAVPDGQVLLVEGQYVSVDGAHEGTHGVFVAYDGGGTHEVTVTDGRYKLVAEDDAETEFCGRLAMIGPNGWACGYVRGDRDWNMQLCGVPAHCRVERS